MVSEGRSSVDRSFVDRRGLPRPRSVGDGWLAAVSTSRARWVLQVRKVGEEDTLVSASCACSTVRSDSRASAQLADRVAGWFGSPLLTVAVVVPWRFLPMSEHAFAITLSVLRGDLPVRARCRRPRRRRSPWSPGAGHGWDWLTTRGHALETLAKVSHVLFDKTGTLTRGILQLGSSRGAGANGRTGRCSRYRGAWRAVLNTGRPCAGGNIAAGPASRSAISPAARAGDGGR